MLHALISLAHTACLGVASIVILLWIVLLILAVLNSIRDALGKAK